MADGLGLRWNWLGGWILLLVLWVVEGGLLLAFPRQVDRKLFDRSGWSRKQVSFIVAGKVFSLACLMLLVLSPLQTGSPWFVVGILLCLLGLALLVTAMIAFRNASPERPATSGPYRISRHPQILALSIYLLGVCLATRSWLGLACLLISRALQHPSLLAEEEACLRIYGEAYRTYMREVPRYIRLLGQ